MIRRAALHRAVVPWGSALAALLLPLLASAVAWPAEPGGSPRMTREELHRRWDLDRNGTIDEGEAAVAASRMRRERSRTSLHRLIDPVTGRLLDDGDDGFGADPAIAGDGTESWLEGLTTPGRSASREWFERWSREFAEAAAADPEPDSGAAPSSDDAPATRPRALSLHGPIPGRPATPTTAAGLSVAARRDESGTADRPAAGADATSSPRRQWPTGGLRAGAEPARPGYGSGVTRDLNAGRPIDRSAGSGGASLPTTARGALRGPAGSGGLVPGGASGPTGPAGGRTPGRPYDPF
jgi:hypothetical protein